MERTEFHIKNKIMYRDAFLILLKLFRILRKSYIYIKYLTRRGTF